MGKAFTAASTLFIIAELLSAYQQYFDTDATQMDGLSPGAFKGYKQFNVAAARQCTPPCPSNAWPALRTIEFYSMWVGNSKVIFSMLLAVIATSDARTRAMGAAAMVLGCCLYFPRMHPAMVEMEAKHDIRSGLATEIADLIGKVFVPMWLIVLLVEVRALAAKKKED